MGDAESLLLVLGVIYLAECLVWVRRGGCVFLQWAGRHFRFHASGSFLSNHRGSLLLSSPLPPLGTAVLGQASPLSIGPDGLFAYALPCLDTGGRARQTAAYVPWSELKSLESRGRNLWINGRLFCRALSAQSARLIAQKIGRLKKAPEGKREKLVADWIEETLDASQAQRRYVDFLKRSKSLRTLTHLLFGYLFLVAPLLVHRYGMVHVGWLLLAGLVLQNVAIAFVFRYHHRALYPEERDDRFKYFLTFLISPPSAIRARDILARHLLEAYHSLAAAKVLCRPDHFRALARAVLIDLRFPLLPTWPEVVKPALASGRWFHHRMTETIEQFLRNQGLDPKALTRPDAPSEPDVHSYCPRCQAQFVTASGFCRDCGNRPLVAFPTLSSPRP